MLEELRVEELQRLLERIGLWTRNRATKNSCIDVVGSKLGDQELDSISDTSSIVASVGQKKRLCWALIISSQGWVLVWLDIDFI